MDHPTTIRTPDQRLRVFVSSTLGELAEERAAVREAVERLHLAPVMFELGARPHPPRELYRAYLAQSHVFVGIYWQRYGWVAPGEEVSGLEDEYRLAGDVPKLLYVKRPAPEREERLDALLDDVRADDEVSYKPFERPDELRELVERDLALLLTERFQAVPARPERGRELASVAPPEPTTAILGRDGDVAEAIARLERGERLVTLTGPGGIGKTRLALEIARAARDDYPDGVHFVPLVSVSDPTLVTRTIAEHLGIRLEGTQSPVATVVDHLRSLDALLVVDNLEQVVEAGGDLALLLEACPHLRILATSRQALRIRAEHEQPVGPLPRPDPGAPLEVLAAEPAVALFAERAHASAATFTLDEGNARDVAELCRRLDGLPLAIELAAARVRLLSPAALLERLDERLDVLGGGPTDLPERQRTLRATIDWSHQLLDDPERALFARLAVFVDSFTLGAAEHVCQVGGEPPVIDTLASLLDKSLVVSASGSSGDEPRFRMLETVRTFAREQLDARGETEAMRRRHLEHFAALADTAQPFLCGPGQRDWSRRLDPDRANLRAAVETALELGEHATLVELAYDVYVYFQIRDAEEEPRSWLCAVADVEPDLDEVVDAKLRSLAALGRISLGDLHDVREPLETTLALFRDRGMAFEAAVCLFQLGSVAAVLDADPRPALQALAEASELFDSVDHDWGVAITESAAGTVEAMEGDLATAETHQQASLARAERIDNAPLIGAADHQLALIRVLEGRPDDARPYLEAAGRVARDGGFRTTAVDALDVAAAIALTRDRTELAARALLTAADARERIGLATRPALDPWVAGLHDRARAALDERDWERVRVAATGSDPIDVLEEVLRALASSPTG